MRRAWLVLVVGFAPAACLFPDLGGLQGGDGAADACATCSDAAPPDVVSDAKPPPVDAGDGGFCASLGGTHALCEDFDHGLFNAQFTNVWTTQFSSVGSDGAEYVSSPLSFFANLQAQSTNNDSAFMARVFNATASSATYSFDFRIDGWTTGDNSGVFAGIVIDEGLSTSHTMIVYLTDVYTALEESFTQADGGTAYIDHPLTPNIALGVWTRVSFTVDFANRTCSATLDGNTALATEPIDPSWAPGAISIDLGLTYVASQTAEWKTRYDDVVFDYQ